MAWQLAPGTKLPNYQCDNSDRSKIRSLYQRIRSEVGDMTVLVLGRGLAVMEGTYADVELTINTILLAPFLLIKEFNPHIVKSNHGHIVNVSSMRFVMLPTHIADDNAATKADLAALHEL
ncbi:short chain dehydrogenase [Colletotrichum orchidophilum]|uniref:Short chain dehydrogenase n=1 Tax=Colletotrichum orchidophilum TaxID=1209926 RepID=A0A1G4B8W2_9PEZI|nr:short chain dehydrogenase [Colletotrichum orchidophilum]OHE97854.1 short chain dehydrogenase [Colletotrichum orchidophilum]